MTQKRRSGSSLFDRFAEAASEFAAHAVFFIACLALVVIWVPSYFVDHDRHIPACRAASKLAAAQR